MTICLGSNTSGQSLGILPETLMTHATVVGMTGSGKTGLVLGIAEQLVKNSIPTVILDIKGDMPNIFLQPEGAVKSKMLPRFLTPGACHGESVNIISGLGDSTRISESVTALLDLINVSSDPLRSKPHVLLSAILEHRLNRKQSCTLLDLIYAIQDPPFVCLGGMDVEEVMGFTTRKSLASKINNVLVAKNFEFWRAGTTLNLDVLTKVEDGKVPVVVYSVAHLVNDDERMFAINILLDSMVSFMRRQNGSSSLRVAFIIDECYGLVPPRGNPLSKTAILTLLKQGRSSGVGVILATQNPMDLDYKGMANCGTWIIGRLQTANDRRRLVEGVCSSVPGLTKSTLEDRIGKLQTRNFLLARNEKLVPFYSRKTWCTLKGPMGISELKDLVPAKPSVTMGIKNKVIQLLTGK